jgi:hypothetical protein
MFAISARRKIAALAFARSIFLTSWPRRRNLSFSVSGGGLESGGGGLRCGLAASGGIRGASRAVVEIILQFGHILVVQDFPSVISEVIASLLYRLSQGDLQFRAAMEAAVQFVYDFVRVCNSGDFEEFDFVGNVLGWRAILGPFKGLIPGAGFEIRQLRHEIPAEQALPFGNRDYEAVPIVLAEAGEP